MQTMEALYKEQIELNRKLKLETHLKRRKNQNTLVNLKNLCNNQQLLLENQKTLLSDQKNQVL